MTKNFKVNDNVYDAAIEESGVITKVRADDMGVPCHTRESGVVWLAGSPPTAHLMDGPAKME